ncbi:interferon lambda-4-like [Enhydra lutris kenyoni]|uniref:Interferon lambda-4-like n=1 Tax=Enhydra lutris kenyoni TaxID=391180 RepID=A0A2Y9L5S8_ENHLU|nr:interferon lambda-4-like [Enhydra lutris kenyoni]
MEGAGTAVGGAEMGRRGGAAMAVALWVLVTAGEAADPGVATPRRCLLSHYRSLDPRALAAVKALRDRYEEETLSWRPRNCSFRPRRDRPPPWSCARLRVVVRDLADAQAVLSRLPSPDRFPGTGPTLQLLAAARRDVGACLELVRLGSRRKSLRPPRRRPPTRRADSPRCHEASVIFNLLRLLTWDLKLVANSGPCL